METIKDVKVGREVNSPRNGKGMITAKTKRTITVTFQNGNTVKNTYRTADASFSDWDF